MIPGVEIELHFSRRIQISIQISIWTITGANYWKLRIRWSHMTNSCLIMVMIIKVKTEYACLNVVLARDRKEWIGESTALVLHKVLRVDLEGSNGDFAFEFWNENRTIPPLIKTYSQANESQTFFINSLLAIKTSPLFLDIICSIIP